MKRGYVYILASRPGGAIYVGVTSNLAKRVAEHKSGKVAGHTKRYGIDKLVHFEIYEDEGNPEWRDLSGEIARP